MKRKSLVIISGILLIALAVAFNYGATSGSNGKGKTDKITSGSSDPARSLTKADLTQRLHKLNASSKPLDVTLSTNTLADLNGMCVELTAPRTVMVNQPFDLFVCITTSTSSLFLPVLALPAQFTLTGERITADSPTRPQYNFTEPPAGVPPIMPCLYPYGGGNIPTAIWALVPATYQMGYNFVNLVDNMRNDHWLSNHMYIFEWRGDNITWHFSGLRTASAGDYKFGLFLNAFWEDSLTGETRSGFITIEEPLSVRPVVTVPYAPSNLIATTVSPNQIDLNWLDNSDNEEAFNIERRTLDTPSIQIATLAPNTTTYSDIALNPSTTYFYRINASNSAGTSPYSNEASATTFPPPVPIPMAPSNLVATAVSHNQINLAWQDNSYNEQGFKIERKTELTGTLEQIAIVDTNVTLYTDSNLSPTTTYYYRVRAYNVAGDSEYSNEADATTFAPIIENIIALVNQCYEKGKITNWGTYNSLISKLDSIEKSLGNLSYNSALGEILALRNSIQSQTGKNINTTEGNILVELANVFYQQTSLDNFYAQLPLVITFNQLDKVKVTLKNYPLEQEITISGEFRHLFYQSSEDPNIIYSLLTELESKTTPLFVPGIGTVELEISRDRATLSWGTIYRDTRKFFWEMNVVAKIVGTTDTIDIKFIVEDDIKFTDTRTMSLSASGSGTIDESVPVFGGATFSFVPGSGCDSKSPNAKSPKEDPSKNMFKPTLDLIAAILSKSEALKSLGAIVEGAVRAKKLAGVTQEHIDEKIMALRNIYAIIAGAPGNKSMELMTFFNELNKEGLINDIQCASLSRNAPTIAKYLDKTISKEDAQKVVDQIKELYKNIREKQKKKEKPK